MLQISCSAKNRPTFNLQSLIFVQADQDADATKNKFGIVNFKESEFSVQHFDV